MTTLVLWLALAAPPAIDCPPYPGDPPWRSLTCYILSRMGEADTRPTLNQPQPESVPEVEW